MPAPPPPPPPPGDWVPAWQWSPCVSAPQSRPEWRDRFDVNKADLLPTGTNAYITMQPGRVLKLKHGNDTLTVTVLPETQEVDGVVTGVLEERETKNGTLVEVSRNFWRRTGTPATSTTSARTWTTTRTARSSITRARGGRARAARRFGLMIPAKPTVGQAFYQEIAPKVAMDRVEVVSTNETVKTPAGTFEHCVHLRETTPLERDVSHKYYAPGIGIIKDDEFELAERPGPASLTSCPPSYHHHAPEPQETRAPPPLSRPPAPPPPPPGLDVIVIDRPVGRCERVVATDSRGISPDYAMSDTSWVDAGAVDACSDRLNVCAPPWPRHASPGSSRCSTRNAISSGTSTGSRLLTLSFHLPIRRPPPLTPPPPSPLPPPPPHSLLTRLSSSALPPPCFSRRIPPPSLPPLPPSPSPPLPPLLCRPPSPLRSLSLRPLYARRRRAQEH